MVKVKIKSKPEEIDKKEIKTERIKIKEKVKIIEITKEKSITQEVKNSDEIKLNIPKKTDKENNLFKDQAKNLQKIQNQNNLKLEIPKDLTRKDIKNHSDLKREKEEVNSTLVNRIIKKLKKKKEDKSFDKKNEKYLTIKDFESYIKDFKSNIQELIGKEFTEAQSKIFEELKSFKEKFEKQEINRTSENPFLKELIMFLVSKDMFNSDQIKMSHID